MTPKEKAQELFDKMQFNAVYVYTNNCAKEHALIAVDEVIKSQKNIFGLNNQATKFYLEVQQEIEKL
jgi:hypothetical protein